MNALKCFGDIKRIAVITPYMPIGDEQVRRYFTDCGFDVVTVKGLKCKSPMLIAHETEKTLRDAINEVNDPSVEAIVQAGTNLAMARVGGIAEFWLDKPVIAAVSGYCVAGGLELAAWCDLRVADADAVFGVFCRRFGVPLIDGGTVRLPRLIGMSRALDLILTGRPVPAEEALQMGLVNRVVARGEAVNAALALARELAAFPQACLRGDRRSAHAQWGLDADAAIAFEFRQGMATLQSGETVDGATRFRDGAGRHGQFGDAGQGT